MEEFRTAFPDCEGVGFKEMQGKTINDFIKQCLIFGSDKKVTTAQLETIYNNFISNTKIGRLNMRQVVKQIWRYGKRL